jgi:hypothetical protein
MTYRDAIAVRSLFLGVFDSTNDEIEGSVDEVCTF